MEVAMPKGVYKRSKKQLETLKKYGFQKGQVFSKEMRSNMSKSHMGIKNYKWKGGRGHHSDGYIVIYAPLHPLSNIRGYVLEHRLVMEKHIGRYLTNKEVVHHINKIKDDNRIENLMLFKNFVDHFKHHRKVKNAQSSGQSSRY